MRGADVLERFEVRDDLRYALQDAHADNLVLCGTALEEETDSMGEETIRERVFVRAHIIGLPVVLI